MANKEHIKHLREGSWAWNQWRVNKIREDLDGYAKWRAANPKGLYIFDQIDLSHAELN
jgi:hypothetical protein